jgi:hypothetical protein
MLLAPAVLVTPVRSSAVASGVEVMPLRKVSGRGEYLKVMAAALLLPNGDGWVVLPPATNGGTSAVLVSVGAFSTR